MGLFFVKKFILGSKRGSTLVVSIIIIILMSLLGVSLTAVTLSSLEMSIFQNSLDKAYFLAEAGAEQVAKVLDQRAYEIQEEARAQASNDIKDQLEYNPLTLREADGSVSLYDENNTKLEQDFKSKYFEYYSTGLESQFYDVGSIEKMMELLDTEYNDGTYPYKDAGDGRIFIKSANFDQIEKTISVEVMGLYNEYEKSIRVDFSLFPQAESIPYKTVEKSVAKNPVKHDILKKALVTEKNLIVTGGEVVIDGDVLSFGKIPVSDTLQEGMPVEDQNAGWYSYGGILVGMCRDIAQRSGEFGFDSLLTGDYANGNLTINGNVSTMGYIQSIYSTSLNQSSVTITGDSHARSIRSSKYSNYSTMTLGNVSIIDNLQVDSNNSVIDVNGVFKGFVDSAHAIDGTGLGYSEDIVTNKNSSSIVVNGDSILNLNNEVYIGGSTFYKNLKDSSDNLFMTGISALKSTARIINAFKKDDQSNPANNIFWYESGEYLEPHKVADFTTYSTGARTYELINGTVDNPGYFPMVNRGMHFKGVWEFLWKSDDIFSKYINPDNINIGGNGITPEGKLKGFSNGAIIANGTVYGVNDFSTVHDQTEFHLNVQLPAMESYFNNVGGFLEEKFSSDYPKLNYVIPTKNLNSYVDNRFVGPNRVVVNKPYVPLDSSRGFLYYGTGDTYIRQIDGIWYINNEIMPQLKGIICVEGNIYVGNEFQFTGIIMSSQNIVFLDNANIIYDDVVVDQLLGADVNTNGFFSLLSYEIPYETLKSQRISTENIEIIKWNEI